MFVTPTHPTTTTTRARRAGALLACGVTAGVLVGCSTAEVDSPAPSSTAASPTASAPATEAGSTAAPAAAQDVTVDVAPAEGLRAGDTVEITLAGLNPKAGYYAAICAEDRPEGSPVPLCTGGRGDATAQAWIKASGGTITLAEDGTAVATIAATPVGEGIDCREDACGVKIFGDHTEGFQDVAWVPVTFAE
ncbi:neocarzinostatin apoprotein domain-containing protein [Corynebacterium sp. 13CS0277]|uniref:neocarzinostatin apoprotein domain-containing protein n=1 Tax=Corynebacterium sp. 13CS0277 TaxID=2071994 RepID=UPI001E54ACF1|nr:neocarzinostatin apoprotein domain-containing protein [Corynebacterium sp. 13CS0277]